MLNDQVSESGFPCKPTSSFRLSSAIVQLRLVARLGWVLVVLCAVCNAQPAIVRAQNRDAQWTLEKARQTVRELAKTETKNDFAVGYMLLLAKHHVVPVLSKGHAIAVGGGAKIEIRDATHFLLHSVDGATDDPGRFGFIRGVTTDGRWTQVDKQPVENLRAMVVKTRDMLFVINLTANTVCPMSTKDMK